jgi:steroid delta-isomerase-like uncharacterized protein
MATVMERWALAWSTHAVDALAELFTDDCVYEDVSFGVENLGREGVRGWATSFLTSFPDLDVSPRRWTQDGALATLEWRMSGSHRSEFAGWPPTGLRFDVRGVTVFELRGERIARCSDYWDLETVQRQLGLAPALPLDGS